MIASTVSAVEVIWLAGGTVAMALSIWAWRDARGDDEALRRRRRNGLLKIASRQTRVSQAGRVAMQALLLLAGLIAATTPEPPPLPVSYEFRRWATISILLAFQWGLAGGALVDRLFRRQMIRYDAKNPHPAELLEQAKHKT